MGIYRYTLRATPKKVRGVQLAQFKFAYKCFWGDDRDPVCRRLEAAGDRAAEKLRNEGVRLFVRGDWHDGQPIYWTDTLFGAFTEELSTTPHVGTLCKDERGRWHILLKTDEQLLQEYPEIGALQTERGREWYHIDRHDRQFQSQHLFRVMTAVKIDRLCRER